MCPHSIKRLGIARSCEIKQIIKKKRMHEMNLLILESASHSKAPVCTFLQNPQQDFWGWRGLINPRMQC